MILMFDDRKLMTKFKKELDQMVCLGHINCSCFCLTMDVFVWEKNGLMKCQ